MLLVVERNDDAAPIAEGARIVHGGLASLTAAALGVERGRSAVAVRFDELPAHTVVMRDLEAHGAGRRGSYLFVRVASDGYLRENSGS